MEQSPLNKIDVVQVVFVVFSFILIGVIFFSPGFNFHYEIFIFLLGGLYSVLTGIRIIRKSSIHQNRIYWYKQSNILFGIAMLLGVPWDILRFNFISVFPRSSIAYTIIEDTILIIALILFIVAGYFVVRGKISRRGPY